MKSLISRIIYPGASRSIDVERVKQTLRPGEELAWQATTRDERIGLILRPPSSKQGWIVFFYGNGMTVVQTWDIRRRLTERPEVADVRTSVIYEHLRNHAVVPDPAVRA